MSCIAVNPAMEEVFAIGTFHKAVGILFSICHCMISYYAFKSLYIKKIRKFKMRILDRMCLYIVLCWLFAVEDLYTDRYTVLCTVRMIIPLIVDELIIFM